MHAWIIYFIYLCVFCRLANVLANAIIKFPIESLFFIPLGLQKFDHEMSVKLGVRVSSIKGDAKKGG